MYYLFCIVLCIVYVYMCTVLLPPGGYPIAVNKYIIYLVGYFHGHNFTQRLFVLLIQGKLESKASENEEGK